MSVRSQSERSQNGAQEQRRRHILAAAGRVFGGDGPATVSQVADEAGVSVGSIYLYFRSKEDLRRAVAHDMAERVLSAEPAAPHERAESPFVEKLSSLELLLRGEIETAPAEDGGGRRLRRNEARRQEVVDAATAVFARRGFHAATTAEVAAEAGIAVGSLYAHFKTKDELYVAVIEDKAEQLLTLLRAELASVPTAAARLHRLIATEIDFFRRNQDFLRIFLATRDGIAWTSRDELLDAVARRHAAYLEILTHVMAQGVEDGELQHAPPRDLACALDGMLGSLIFHWAQEDGLDQPEARADWLTGLFRRATGAETPL